MLHKVHTVPANSATHKIELFFKGVWGISLRLHLLAVVATFTVPALTFKMLVFKFAVRCGAKRSHKCRQSLLITIGYTNKYKKHECHPSAPPAVTDFQCPRLYRIAEMRDVALVTICNLGATCH